VRALALLLLIAVPAYAQGGPQPQPPDASLPALIAGLKAAPNPEAAGQLEHKIAVAWLDQATPAVRLLLESGMRALDAEAPNEAERDFSAATTLQPDLAEAWSESALAHLHAGDTTAAIEDLAHALTLDPEHFTALETLSYAAEERGDWPGALTAWQKLLSIDPEIAGGAERLKKLRQHALGESL